MRFSRYIAVIALILIISLWLVSLSYSVRVEAQQNFAGSVQPVAGLVQYQASGTQAWVTLTEQQIVRVGDQIRTGADGFAQLSIISGIELDIYPTTQLQVSVLQQRADRGTLISISQIVGKLLSRVDRTIRPEDRFQVVLPTAGITVEGTQFWSLVTPQLHGAVVVQEGAVNVLSGDGQSLAVTVEDFLFVDFRLPDPAPSVCTGELLRENTTATLVLVPLAGNTSRENATRAFLSDIFTSNSNPNVRVFMRELLGLPAQDDAALDADADEQAVQDILDAIRTVNLATVDLEDLLARYRTYWLSTYRATLANPLPPATCGNLQVDDGETAENCPTDFSEVGFCGNGICETNRRGAAESVINCPVDCLGGLSLALSCLDQSASGLGLRTEVPLPTDFGPGTRQPRITRTPTPITPIGTVTPTPSQ